MYSAYELNKQGDNIQPLKAVLHHLPELSQTHALWVGNAIQSSRHLSPPSPLAFSLYTASGSFLISQFFASVGQSTGVSVSVPVLSMNIQDWVPLVLTGLVSLQPKGLSGTISSTTVQKHQFFGSQPFYGSIITYIHDYRKNHRFDYKDLCWQSNVSAF